jgi:hypothetical protein
VPGNAPTIGALSPGVIYRGHEFTITGANLAQFWSVSVAGVHCPTASAIGPGSIRVVPAGGVPAGLGREVFVAMKDGSFVSTYANVEQPPAPVVVSVAPSVAFPGQRVTVMGTNLDTAHVVRVGNTAGLIVAATPTQVEFVVDPTQPSGTDQTVVVGTQYGASVSGKLSVTAHAAPAVAGTLGQGSMCTAGTASMPWLVMLAAGWFQRGKRRSRH